MRARPAAALLAAAFTLLAAVLAGCGGSSTSGPAASGPVTIVAAENFWGSIAGQLAGSKATVHSIIRDPAADPHSYQPTAADARTFATAKLALVNGVGYDPWAPKLLSANPVPGRMTLDVGKTLGLSSGDNPHRWYDPANVEAVANAVTADLKQLDPNDAAYFDRQHAAFASQRLQQYHQLISAIKARYTGVPVGASESIFALLAPSLGLKLVTPPSFMKAISEGTDVTAQDTATTQQQLATHQIKVWIYNSQNATPAIKRLNQLAGQNGIPITTVTETLTPATTSFEQWQVAQLQALQRALRQATGR
jgi:zinc/manganese transport system substrate-binding protein